MNNQICSQLEHCELQNYSLMFKRIFDTFTKDINLFIKQMLTHIYHRQTVICTFLNSAQVKPELEAKNQVNEDMIFRLQNQIIGLQHNLEEEQILS